MLVYQRQRIRDEMLESLAGWRWLNGIRYALCDHDKSSQLRNRKL